MNFHKWWFAYRGAMMQVGALTQFTLFDLYRSFASTAQ